HHDPTWFFDSPPLDRTDQPKDDPFGARGARLWMSGVGSEVSASDTSDRESRWVIMTQPGSSTARLWTGRINQRMIRSGPVERGYGCRGLAQKSRPRTVRGALSRE